MKTKSKDNFKSLKTQNVFFKLEAIEWNLVDFRISSTDYTCPIPITKVWVMRVYLMKYLI